MPNVLNEFAGDGVTKTFTFAMTGGYLNRDYVFFFTRPNDDLLNYTPYDDANVTWVGDFTIELSAPIPIGTTFVILRSTPLSPLVDFQNTSRITEKNLDTATWQGIHIAAESSDMLGIIQVVAADSKVESAEALLNSQTAVGDSSAAVSAANAAVGTANTAMSVATEAKALIDAAVAGTVVSFNGRVGTVLPEVGDYTKAMVGLSAVDNTSDVDKPVSAATQTALDTKVDQVVGKQLSTEDFTSAEKAKLAGVESGANAYTHPTTHPASTITQDANNRFVSDAEKEYWGSKQEQLVSGTNIKTLNGVSILGSGNIVISGGELFEYAWHNGPRSSIAPGRVPTDGQQLLLLTHPDVCQAIWDGKQHAVNESAWQADPTYRNCWSRGDGQSWVRVPDLNAAVAGTGKPFYLRGGDGSLNGSSVGDAIRNITAGMALLQGGKRGLAATDGGTGAVRTYATGIGHNAPIVEGTSWGFTFNASLVVPTADENRVKTAYGVMTVRVFTEVSNKGALDASQLATQLGLTDARVQTLDANTGFTIIYPNGGSAAAPANAAINSRYVTANPFPGYHVICCAELFVGGAWGATGWIYSAGGMGVVAAKHGDNIITTTGSTHLYASVQDGGGSINYTGPAINTPTPVRVKVWKLKGGA